uniref:Retrovirus-related Pol polyprotein from transposon TNT 1-94 n=1 Tax=Tanacetum cinerariifolium TaxID=118510 RepID=A0A6L2MZX6_TANCI|nr:retrovirus-related Pol polyprotein from transposon TNT 1-94 [Tanacetum cinerariifolium]
MAVHEVDKIEWRVSGIVKSFAVSTVWMSIRPRDTIVDWADVVWTHMSKMAGCTSLHLNVYDMVVIPYWRFRVCKYGCKLNGVNYKPNVTRPQLKSNQSRDKVLPNNSQVKAKETRVEVHPRIPSVLNKMNSVTACQDSLNSRTLNANAVCATCNKCLIDSNHFACVTKMLNDVHARTKKPVVVPISTRKPNTQANKSIATPNKKKVALKSTNKKPQSYFKVLYKNTNKAWSLTGYKWVPKPKKQWVP